MERHSKAYWRNIAETRLLSLQNLEELNKYNANRITDLSNVIMYLAQRLGIKENYLKGHGYFSQGSINRLINDIKLQEAQVRAEEAAERLGLIGKETKDV